MLTRDSKFYDRVCDKEEDVVGNYRILCSNCKNEIALVMAMLYTKKHLSSRIEKCPYCKTLNLVWDKDYLCV